MKKNRFIKIAAVVFTLCLITTCGISSTLAKYTTSSSASDTARVAKWGVEVSTSGTMFGKAYGANGSGATANRIVAETSASVNTSNSNKIVAPGTMNDTGIQIKIKGKPEVAFDLSASGTVGSEIWLGNGNWGVLEVAAGINAATDFATEKLYLKNGDAYERVAVPHTYSASNTYYRLSYSAKVVGKYYPIVWTGEIVATDTDGIGNGKKDFTTLQNAVNALTVNGINLIDNFDANDNVDLVYTLTWEWPFHVSDEKDAYDTILGDLMAGDRIVVLLSDDANTATAPVANTDYSLTVACNISVSATQIN